MGYKDQQNMCSQSMDHKEQNHSKSKQSEKYIQEVFTEIQ